VIGLTDTTEGAHTWDALARVPGVLYALSRGLYMAFLASLCTVASRGILEYIALGSLIENASDSMFSQKSAAPE
jgi:hypothetical protein